MVTEGLSPSQCAARDVFWLRVALEATAALDDVPADHPERASLLEHVKRCRKAAGLPVEAGRFELRRVLPEDRLAG